RRQGSRQLRSDPDRLRGDRRVPGSVRRYVGLAERSPDTVRRSPCLGAFAMLWRWGAAALHHQYDLAPSFLARGKRAIRLDPVLERQPVRDHAGEQVSLTLRERQRVRQQPAGRTPAGRVDEVAVVELARRERKVLLGVNTDGGECAAWS